MMIRAYNNINVKIKVTFLEEPRTFHQEEPNINSVQQQTPEKEGFTFGEIFFFMRSVYEQYYISCHK